MTTQWEYIGTVVLPTAIPSAMKDEWATTLIAEQSRIYSGLTTKVANESNFQDRIADASSDQFAEFLATVGGAWDADMIEMKQRVKLARQYNAWKDGIDACFTGGSPYFADRVNAKKDKLELARYVLGAVGYKADPSGSFGVWNPATVGCLLMRGDTRPARYFDSNDSFTGTLHAVMEAKKGALITPSILGEAIQACVMAKFADEGALTTLRDTIITNANATIDDLIQVALDATHLGGSYDVTYVLSWSAPDTNVKITVTDTHP
jgi:hypothetical protein